MSGVFVRAGFVGKPPRHVMPLELASGYRNRPRATCPAMNAGRAEGAARCRLAPSRRGGLEGDLPRLVFLACLVLAIVLRQRHQLLLLIPVEGLIVLLGFVSPLFQCLVDGDFFVGHVVQAVTGKEPQ
jgi:hypothetical protein